VFDDYQHEPLDDHHHRHGADYDHHLIDSEEDEYPVYPYEASIFYDVANGYDIYYDPTYSSPYEQHEIDQLMTDREEEYFN